MRIYQLYGEKEERTFQEIVRDYQESESQQESDVDSASRMHSSESESEEPFNNIQDRINDSMRLFGEEVDEFDIYDDESDD